jgi:hypothetical protein
MGKSEWENRKDPDRRAPGIFAPPAGSPSVAASLIDVTGFDLTCKIPGKA